MEDYIDILLTHLSEQRPFSTQSEEAAQTEARRATQALWETFSPRQRKLFLAYESAQNAVNTLSEDAYARAAFLLAREIYR